MAEYWDSTDSLEELEEDREEDCTRIAGAFAGQNAASQVLGQEKLGATKTYDRAKVADPSASKKFHAAQFGEANCQVKCNTSAGEANRRHFLGL